ncbi:hypothetical protein HOLleu_35369 [Holothuria leucospilota]|uniref:MRH domain-containing protein n=1 Tax=Holothuria leucospilota TaxID=206669 RepID=A0A9Q0YMK1_HOLLE|nr:hypothetical protein HOLleu_35369 [Holothuria leucospilota]
MKIIVLVVHKHCRRTFSREIAENYEYIIKMANSFVTWSLAWLGTSLVFGGLPLCRGQATGSCMTVNPCRCTYSDGSYIDLSKISKIGKFMYVYLIVHRGSQPNLSSACQKIPQDKSGKRYPLGDASSANFTGSDSDIAITYSATDRVGTRRFLTVTLVCDQTASTPRLYIPGETSTTVYEYVLTSKSCCPKRCETVVYSNGLSFGSILCLVFSWLLIVCLVTGVVYNKLFCKAEGKEVVPNYYMWTQDPESVKACQKNPKPEPGKRYPLGDASSADFTGSDSDISITYSATDGEGTRRFSCLLFVYLVAGVLYMKFIRKAEGKEVIPNYSMWVQVPGLVKDGGKFTYSRIGQLCGKKSPSTYDNI